MLRSNVIIESYVKLALNDIFSIYNPEMIPYIKTLFVKYNDGKAKIINQTNNNSTLESVDDADSLQNNTVDFGKLARNSVSSRLVQKQ